MQSFNRYSAANASLVKSRLSCGCEPYKDVFTYNRWKQEGYQVMRGEKAIKIPVVVEKQDEETQEHYKRLWHSAVFCRHQVKVMGQREAEPMPILPAKVEPKTESTPKGDDNMVNWRIV